MLLQARLSCGPVVLEAIAISCELIDFGAICASSRGYLAARNKNRIISRIYLALEYEADHVIDLLNGFVNRMLLYMFQRSILMVIYLDLLLRWKVTFRFGQVLILLLWHLVLLLLLFLIRRAFSVRAGRLNLRTIRFLS